MPLLDKIFSKKVIVWCLITFVLVVILYFGFRYFSAQRYNRESNEMKAAFFVLLDNGSHDEIMESWPEVYTRFRDDNAFLEEFSDEIFDMYVSYYQSRFIESIIDEEKFLLCRNFYSFLEKDSFEMTVSAIYDDYLGKSIDYRTFISAMNDFYLFSLYESPKIVELLDLASLIYDSRQSYLLAESNHRTGEYDKAIELYKNVIPQDIIYYPLAIEKIDECIELLRVKIANGN